MKSSVCLHSTNSADWERVQASDWSRPPAVPDHKLGDASQFKGVKGYGSYLKQARESGSNTRSAFGRVDKLVLSGNPDQLISQLRPTLTSLGAQEVQFHFLYADIPLELAESSMRLFAKEVMPMVKELDVPLPEDLAGQPATA